MELQSALLTPVQQHLANDGALFASTNIPTAQLLQHFPPAEAARYQNGVEPDIVDVAKWLSISEHQGREGASALLTTVFASMSNYQKGVVSEAWKRTQPNCVNPLYFYQQAANESKPDPDAICRAAELLVSGDPSLDIKPDKFKAVQFLAKLTPRELQTHPKATELLDNLDSASKYQLAVLCEKAGSEAHMVFAYNLYREAAQDDHTESLCWLAKTFFKGNTQLCLSPNKHLAQHYLDRVVHIHHPMVYELCGDGWAQRYERTTDIKDLKKAMEQYKAAFSMDPFNWTIKTNYVEYLSKAAVRDDVSAIYYLAKAHLDGSLEPLVPRNKSTGLTLMTKASRLTGVPVEQLMGSLSTSPSPDPAYDDL